jgi:hypothetical protein
MQKNSRSTSNQAKATRASAQQRKLRRQQLFLGVVGIVVILAMVLALVVKV